MISKSLLILIIKSGLSLLVIFLSQYTAYSEATDLNLKAFYSISFYMAIFLPPVFLKIKQDYKLNGQIDWHIITINAIIMYIITDYFVGFTSVMLVFFVAMVLERIIFLLNFVFISKILTPLAIPVTIVFLPSNISMQHDVVITSLCVLLFCLIIFRFSPYVAFIKGTVDNSMRCLLLISTRSRLDGFRLFLSERLGSASDTYIILLPVQLLLNYTDIKLSYAERGYLEQNYLRLESSRLDFVIVGAVMSTLVVTTIWLDVSYWYLAVIIAFSIIFLHENITSILMQYNEMRSEYVIRLVWLINYLFISGWLYVFFVVAVAYSIILSLKLYRKGIF